MCGIKGDESREGQVLLRVMAGSCFYLLELSRMTLFKMDNLVPTADIVAIRPRYRVNFRVHSILKP